MRREAVYLNNAATSYPKPEAVLAAARENLNALPCGGQRGGHNDRRAADACRESLAPLLGVGNPSRIFFTSGATESANLLLRGYRPSKGRPRIVTTVCEHNAVLRPLYAMFGRENIPLAPCDANGYVKKEVFEKLLGSDVGLVIVSHVSNVTGAVQDLQTLAQAAKENGALFFADVSQSAGLLPVRADEWGADALIFTGHKALFGLAGTGGFFLREGASVSPGKFGGSGGTNIPPWQPNGDYEVGTLNEVGIASLGAGCEWVRETGLKNISARVRGLIRKIADGLRELPLVTVYTDAERENGACAAFNFAGLSPADAAYILLNAYGIIVRAGHHCAPLMGEAINAPGGTVRVSVSALTSEDDVDIFLNAAKDIHEGLDRQEFNRQEFAHTELSCKELVHKSEASL